VTIAGPRARLRLRENMRFGVRHTVTHVIPDPKSRVCTSFESVLRGVHKSGPGFSNAKRIGTARAASPSPWTSEHPGHFSHDGTTRSRLGRHFKQSGQSIFVKHIVTIMCGRLIAVKNATIRCNAVSKELC
jgi:hypothetical protein